MRECIEFFTRSHAREGALLKSSLLTILALCVFLAAGCRSGRVVDLPPDNPDDCLWPTTEIWSDPTENGQDIIVEVEIPDNKPGADVEIELENLAGLVETFKVESPPAPPQFRSIVLEDSGILFVRTRCVREPANECICNYNYDVSLDL